MPHNERCGKPDSIGDKRRKKKPACSVVEQAGVPIDRGIMGLRGRKVKMNKSRTFARLLYVIDSGKY